jgi:hypothetical protein
MRGLARYAKMVTAVLIRPGAVVRADNGPAVAWRSGEVVRPDCIQAKPESRRRQVSSP